MKYLSILYILICGFTLIESSPIFVPYNENYTIYSSFYPQSTLTNMLTALNCIAKPTSQTITTTGTCIPPSTKPTRTNECTGFFTYETGCNVVQSVSTNCYIQGCSQCDATTNYCLACDEANYYQVLPTPSELANSVYTIYCLPKNLFTTNPKQLDSNGLIKSITIDPTLNSNSTTSALDFSLDIFQSTFGNDACWFAPRMYMNQLMKQSYYYKYLGYIVLEGMFFKLLSQCSQLGSISSMDQYGNIRGNTSSTGTINPAISWAGIVDSTNKNQCAFIPMAAFHKGMSAKTCFTNVISKISPAYLDAIYLLDQAVSSSQVVDTSVTTKDLAPPPPPPPGSRLLEDTDSRLLEENVEENKDGNDVSVKETRLLQDDPSLEYQMVMTHQGTTQTLGCVVQQGEGVNHKHNRLLSTVPTTTNIINSLLLANQDQMTAIRLLQSSSSSSSNSGSSSNANQCCVNGVCFNQQSISSNNTSSSNSNNINFVWGSDLSNNLDGYESMKSAVFTILAFQCVWMFIGLLYMAYYIYKHWYEIICCKSRKYHHHSHHSNNPPPPQIPLDAQYHNPPQTQQLTEVANVNYYINPIR